MVKAVVSKDPQPLWMKDLTQDEIDAHILAEEQAQNLAELSATDKDMARVGEDIIDALIDKGVLTMSDLPQATQDKISQRKTLRAKIG